ncbi:hypothetical protein [Nocardiopsis quinghaiensis]|uniref:hypothetical protein n=1 Tax=Nocardiopsis quinghaiensis TaxID=464995 RepID=UPI0012392C2F|nr:hypothetical protein [Nocardiopsis quinghaiensis]
MNAPPSAHHLPLFQRDRTYHEVRVLMLVNAVARAYPEPGHVDGLTQLAKLDFFLRYPHLAVRALEGLEPRDPRLHLSAPDAQAVEAPMRRHRYGPWDERYYTVVGALISRRLLQRGEEGRARITLSPTVNGTGLALHAATLKPWARTASRCDAIAEAAGHLNGNQLAGLIRDSLPEVGLHDFGEEIT